MKTKYEITFTNIFLFLGNKKLYIEQCIIGKSLYIFLKYKENIKLINEIIKQRFPIIYVFDFNDIYEIDEYIDSLEYKVNLIVFFKWILLKKL